MIEFAQKTDITELKRLWKTVFGDTDFFINLFFDEKFDARNTLIFRHEDKIVAALYMSPYKFRLRGAQIIDCCYLSGLGTLPEWRGRGFMSRLIERAHEILTQRAVPLAILVPSEQSLYAFYENFGYRQQFRADSKPIELAKFVDSAADLRAAFALFDAEINSANFSVQKTFADFRTIIADWEYDRRPAKTNIAGMAKIFDPSIQIPENEAVLNLMLE